MGSIQRSQHNERDSRELQRRNGCYPEAILADRIYRNRDNLSYCKEHGIRLASQNWGDQSPHEES